MSESNDPQPQNPNTDSPATEPTTRKWTWRKGASKKGQPRPVGGRALPGCTPAYVRWHPWQKGQFKVDYILKDQHRQDYETLLTNPKTTVAHAWQWLKDRGYEVGYVAVMNHRREFVHELRELQRAGRLAATFAKEAAACGGEDAFPAAALTRVHMLAMDRLFRRSNPATGDESDPQENLSNKDLSDLAKILATAVGARYRLQQLRRVLEAARAAAASQPGEPAPQAVVDRVREILGIPLGDDET